MPTRRLETLDALRGTAAFFVLLYHIDIVNSGSGLAPHGYLAVDFFFILSGFVIAHCYEGNLRRDLSFGEFLLKRSVRIYPLALIGALAGLVILLMKWYTHPAKVDPLPRILLSGLCNVLLFPTPFNGPLFPGNGPLWTLFFEMFANVVWALIGIWARTRVLIVFAAASWIALAVLSVRFGTLNIGFDQATFWGGMARVCFGFTSGVIIHRFLPWLSAPSFRHGTWILMSLLTCILILPDASSSSGIPWLDLSSVLLVLPTIVVLGIAQIDCKQFGAWFGNLSYPLYIIHFPFLLLVSGLHRSWAAAVNVHLLSLATVIAVVVLALAASRLYDTPLRAWLTGAAVQAGLIRRDTRQGIRPPRADALAAGNDAR